MKLVIALTLMLARNALAGLGLSQGNNRPCPRGYTGTDCNPNRLKPCGTIQTGFTKTTGNSGRSCTNSNGQADPYETDVTFLVQFDGQDGCLEGLFRSGECFGDSPVTGSNYDCNGRAGASCAGSVCSNWSTDTLRHDICSWYYSSSGGATDPDCGDEFTQAADDYAQICWWWGQQPCEATNHAISGSRYGAICT